MSNQEPQDRFPTAPSIPDEQIERDYVQLSHDLSPDRLCHFGVAVTRSWRAVQIAPQVANAETPEVSAALLRRTEAPEAEMELRVFHMPVEVHPADFLELWQRGNGHEPEAGRRLPSPLGEVGDSLSITRPEGSPPVAHRCLCVRDGALYFILECRVLDGDYAELADEFLLALQNFQLRNPTGLRFAEPVEEHAFEQPLAGQFLAPASWERQDDPSAPEDVTSFSLVNRPGDRLRGQLTFSMVPAEYEDSHQRLLDNYLEQLAANGAELDARDLQQDAAPEGVQAAWSGLLYGTWQDQAMEVRCVVLRHEEAWLLVAVAGPARGGDAEASMINTRALDLALETLTLG